MSSSEEDSQSSKSLLKQDDFDLKKIRIIKAIEENNVDTLRTLLDSSELYKITNESDDNLLQIAILSENKGVFDYLLSLDDYPFDAINAAGESALITSLCDFVTGDLYMTDYFALELIRKGANIHRNGFNGDSFLHAALERDFVEVAQLLVEKGVDVNRENEAGYTPLHMCCIWCSDDNLIEGVLMLLHYGADATIRDSGGLTFFDMIVKASTRDIPSALESFGYYLFDDHSKYDIDAGALLKIAEIESPFFDQILKNVGEVSVNLDYNPEYLFLLKPKYLQIFIDRFDLVIREVLRKESEKISFLYTSKPVHAENFYILVTSKLKLEFIHWLRNVEIEGIIENFVQYEKSESALTELICFLLSYGMTVYTKNLKAVFKKFGHCKLFKILLHMDVVGDWYNLENIMARLLCDVSLDIQKYIDDPLTLSIANLREMLPFYAIPKLKDFLGEFGTILTRSDLHEKVQNQPQIPLLVELARNMFRKYFIQKFSITNSRQFYTLLKQLPISAYHKKIITLEVQLY